MARHWTPRPGDVVWASRGVYAHLGIVTDVIVDGMPTVISASKQMQRVVEETWARFGSGAPVQFHSYPGQLQRWIVVARARAQIGRPWRLLDNCEHLVTRAHGLPPQSQQVQFAAAAALAAVVVLGR